MMKLNTIYLSVLKRNRINTFRAIRYYSAKVKSKLTNQAENAEGFRLYTFGLTEHGALGLKKDCASSRLGRNAIRPIRHLFGEENCVTDVACGFGFTAIAVNSKDTFKVYGCGINTDKQLTGDPCDLIHTPYPINLGIQHPETQVISISAGRAHLAVATDNEGVFLVGSNCYGQCGRPIVKEEKSNCSFVVNHIEDIDGCHVSEVSCGQDHTIFLTDEGQLYSCGWGSDGQTGLDDTRNVDEPCRIEGDLVDEFIVRVSGRSDTVLAINKEGQVFGWGNSEYLQLSPSKEIDQLNFPVPLKHLNKIGRIKDVATSGTACVALTESGEVYVWGHGILGTSSSLQTTNVPVYIPRTLFGCNHSEPDVKVCKIFCGLTYIAAINSKSHLYCWGINKHGALGIGHLKNQFFPYKVALGSLAVKASCGVDHTMVLCRPFG